MDRLRLPRRADPVRVAVDQLAVWDCRYVRLPEGRLLLLQVGVGEGADAAPVSALELGRADRQRGVGVGLFESGRSGAVPQRQEPGAAEDAGAGASGVEGEIRAGLD